jgi:hypothetical protein
MRSFNAIALVNRPVRRHADRIASEFEIDGRSLQDHLERAVKRKFEVASPIGWTKGEYLGAYARRLLLLAPPVLPSGRRELLVCPECADLACGCLSAEITIDNDHVRWSALGRENDFDAESLMLFGLGAFVFQRCEYERLLRGYGAIE